MQVEVVGVKFKNSNHVYSFDPNGLELKMGDYVLVDTEKGTDLGVIIKEKYQTDAERSDTAKAPDSCRLPARYNR